MTKATRTTSRHKQTMTKAIKKVVSVVNLREQMALKVAELKIRINVIHPQLGIKAFLYVIIAIKETNTHDTIKHLPHKIG